MARESSTDRLTYLSLILVVTLVIAASILIAVMPPSAPGKDVTVLAYKDGYVFMTVQPILEEKDRNIVIRMPGGVDYAMLLITEDGYLYIYNIVDKPFYYPLLPYPALASPSTPINLSVILPGDVSTPCVIADASLEQVGSVDSNIVIALAYSPVDSVKMTFQVSEEATIEVSTPFKLKTSNASGIVASTPIEPSTSVETVATRPGEGVMAVIGISLELYEGEIEFDCSGQRVDVPAMLVVPRYISESINIEYINDPGEIPSEYFLPSSTAECGLVKPDIIGEGEPVYSELFGGGGIALVSTANISESLIGLNVKIEGVDIRITVVSGEDGYKTLCVYKDVNGDPVPIIYSYEYIAQGQ